MDMSNNYTLIDQKYKYPFLLQLMVGGKTLPIKYLVTDIAQAQACEYEIEEYKDVAISFTHGQSDITVVWNKVFDEDEADQTETVCLNEITNIATLYENRNGMDDYPWRCGNYLFEVQYESKIFYGMFSVLPKNLNEIQLKKIHETLNQKLQGLTEEMLKYSQGAGGQSKLDHLPFALFFKWFERVEPQFYRAITLVQNDSESVLKRSYKLESVPKHIDRYSIKWGNSPKGLLYKDLKYLNRKYSQFVDHVYNRNFKAQLIEVLNILINGKKELVQYLDIQKDHMKETEQDLDKVKIEIQMVEKIRTVSRASKNKLKNNYKYLQIKLIELHNDEKQIRGLLEKTEKSCRLLQATLQNAFWKQIQVRKAAGKMVSNKKGYLLLDQILKKFAELSSKAPKEEEIVPVSRPTYLLYEYYVFFSVLDALQNLDYHFPPNSQLKDQLQAFLYKDGIMDGTALRMLSADGRSYIRIVYNEEVERRSQYALEKQKHFFSLKSHRKPDIKIDLYDCETDEFKSSYVVEVKYRPLYSIYQPNGSTPAMEQMDDYRGISYIRNKGIIEHSVVKDVICAYPGNEHAEKLIPSDYGYFLQMYPEGESDITVGEKELTELLSIWIEMYFPFSVESNIYK